MDDTYAKRNQIIQQLRHAILALQNEQTVENVETFHEKLISIPKEYLQESLVLVIRPLVNILNDKKALSEKLCLSVLRSLHFAISRVDVTMWQTLLDVLTPLCKMLHMNNEKIQLLSEETKIEVLCCIQILCKHIDTGVCELFYNPISLAVVGHCVAMILSIAEKESWKQLQKAALHCLMNLAQLDRMLPEKLRATIGSIFASFLPGILLSLSKIMLGDEKQGQSVISTAYVCWYKIVILVLGDENICLAEKYPLEYEKTHQCAQLVQERNKRYAETQSKKVCMLIEKICNYTGNDQMEVTNARIDWACHLLMHCDCIFQTSVPHLLELIVRHMSHIEKKSYELIERTLEYIKMKNQHLFHEILDENMYKLTVNLPRIIRSEDEAEQLLTLRTLTGYLQLLGADGTTTMLHSQAHRTHLAQALLQVLELDCSQISIFQVVPSNISYASISHKEWNQRPKQVFKHFTDTKILEQVQLLCHIVGYYGNIDVALDPFMDSFVQTSLHRKQAALIMCYLVEGALKTRDELQLHKAVAGNNSKASVEAVIKSLVGLFMEEEYFNHPITNFVSNEGSDVPDSHVFALAVKGESSYSKAQNILQISVLLECIGKLALTSGKQFSCLLMDVLYPVLEKLGVENYLICQSAFMTLCDIARACEYKDVENLLQENADYLVNSVSLRLRHLRIHPLAPVVLKVVIIYSSCDILVHIKHIVDEVLSSLDEYFETDAVMFVQVLSSLIWTIAKWFPEVMNNECRDFKNKKIDSVTEYLKRYIEEKEKTNFDDEIADDETNENLCENLDYGSEEEKKDPPVHVTLTKEVLERCRHLQSAPDARLRLQVLEMMASACKVLARHEDILLPLVHRLWPGFVARFSDREPLVAIKACDTLRALADTSEDFIRQRVVKDVLPKLESYLTKQAKISHSASHSYTYGMAFKLQLAILRHVGELCIKIDLQGFELNKVILASSLYLSSLQPCALQQAALSAFSSFLKLDADLVWLVCHTWARNSDLPLLSPGPDFMTYKFQNSEQDCSEYRENMAEVLKSLNEMEA